MRLHRKGPGELLRLALLHKKLTHHHQLFVYPTVVISTVSQLLILSLIVIIGPGTPGAILWQAFLIRKFVAGLSLRYSH